MLATCLQLTFLLALAHGWGVVALETIHCIYIVHVVPCLVPVQDTHQVLNDLYMHLPCDHG